MHREKRAWKDPLEELYERNMKDPLIVEIMDKYKEEDNLPGAQYQDRPLAEIIPEVEGLREIKPVKEVGVGFTKPIKKIPLKNEESPSQRVDKIMSRYADTLL